MFADSDNSKKDVQPCNDNNDSSKPNSTENMKNNDECNDSAKILNWDEPKIEKVNDLDEFEQVLSEYTEQRNSNNFRLNTTQESIGTETIIDMSIDIAETTNNENNFKTRQVDVNNEVCTNNSVNPDMNKNLPINCTHDSINNEETLSIKAEVDFISLSSNERINIDESEQNVDQLSTIFASNDENKSIEIEIDIKNEMAHERMINNSFFEDFAEAGPSGLNYTNFDIDAIDLCKNSSIYDMNTIMDLTDSPNNSLLEQETAEIKIETTQTVSNIDISNTGNTLEFENGGNETKYIHMFDNKSDCSFHSSDFELITEEEARMDGLIINFRQHNEINDENVYNNENINDMCLPGPSDDNAYRENHRIPEGDEFFNMFHGIYAPANIPDLIFLENKSVVPSQCMNVESDNFGYDLAALNKDVLDEEYQDEAKETAKKILNSYHNGNDRTLRRRPL